MFKHHFFISACLDAQSTILQMLLAFFYAVGFGRMKSAKLCFQHYKSDTLENTIFQMSNRSLSNCAFLEYKFCAVKFM